MRGESTLQVLRSELKFVQKGGYRAPLVWRAPLVFEDSPTCPKKGCSSCPVAGCALMRFVTKEHPCRYIPLNESGETVDSLYRTGTNEEVEQMLVSWLLETIRRLEVTSGQPWVQKAA